MQNTLLTPRFYTTDFDELDAIDVSSVRADWDKLIDQMESTPTRAISRRTKTGTMSIGRGWSRG